MNRTKLIQLQQSLSEMRALVQNLQQQLEETQRNGVNIPQQIVSVPVQNPEPTVQLPDLYHGNLKSLRGVLNQLRLVWQLKPRQFHSDALKVGLLGTLLHGPALRWFSPLLEAQDPRLNDATSVIRMLKEAFGDPNPAAKAARQLESLQQGVGRPLRTLWSFE